MTGDHNFFTLLDAVEKGPESYRGALGELTTNADPVISISESPGIHSTAMQARVGALPGVK